MVYSQKLALFVITRTFQTLSVCTNTKYQMYKLAYNIVLPWQQFQTLLKWIDFSEDID